MQPTLYPTIPQAGYPPAWRAPTPRYGVPALPGPAPVNYRRMAGAPMPPMAQPVYLVSPVIRLDVSQLNGLMQQYAQLARQKPWFSAITPWKGALIGGMSLACVACVLHGRLEAMIMNGLLGTVAGGSLASLLRKRKSGNHPSGSGSGSGTGSGAGGGRSI